MHWHYEVYGDFCRAVAIAVRETRMRGVRFSVVEDRYGNFSVWPGSLWDTEAIFVTLLPR